MKTMLIVENSQGRERLFAAAEEGLGENEAIVKITDTISLEHSTLTVPMSHAAEVIARDARSSRIRSRSHRPATRRTTTARAMKASISRKTGDAPEEADPPSYDETGELGMIVGVESWSIAAPQSRRRYLESFSICAMRV